MGNKHQSAEPQKFHSQAIIPMHQRKEYLAYGYYRQTFTNRHIAKELILLTLRYIPDSCLGIKKDFKWNVDFNNLISSRKIKGNRIDIGGVSFVLEMRKWSVPTNYHFCLYLTTQISESITVEYCLNDSKPKIKTFKNELFLWHSEIREFKTDVGYPQRMELEPEDVHRTFEGYVILLNDDDLTKFQQE